MLKKVFITFCSLFLLLTITACNQEQATNTSPNNKVVPTETEATNVVTEEKATETEENIKEPKENNETIIEENTENDEEVVTETEKEEVTIKADQTKVSAIVVTDSRCKDQLCANLNFILDNFKTDLPNLTIQNLDFTTEEWKTFYKENELSLLPVILFDENITKTKIYNEGKDGDERTKMSNYIDIIKEKYYSLRLGSQYDPMKEICDNNIDDNENGAIDCEDSSCQTDLACNKVAKPVVELFVMSYCPYGTQSEKAFLPVVKALGNNIDFKVKFVDYAMHGETEVLEQLKQYCIQKEEPTKFLDYLECFLGDETKGDSCLDENQINRTTLETCQTTTDAEFKIKELLADQASWQGGKFPQFNTDKEAVVKYKVQGSPSLVINGTSVKQFNRSEQSVLDLICGTFTEKPAICDSDQFSSQVANPGFGWKASASNNASDASCETN